MLVRRRLALRAGATLERGRLHFDAAEATAAERKDARRQRCGRRRRAGEGVGRVMMNVVARVQGGSEGGASPLRGSTSRHCDVRSAARSSARRRSGAARRRYAAHRRRWAARLAAAVSLAAAAAPLDTAAPPWCGERRKGGGARMAGAPRSEDGDEGGGKGSAETRVAATGVVAQRCRG